MAAKEIIYHESARSLILAGFFIRQQIKFRMLR